VASKDKFSKSSTGGLQGTFAQYGSADLNAFKPDGKTGFDYPWQDIFGKKLKEKKEKILAAYQKRAFFKPLYEGEHFILNSEELATIYHFPGRVSKTPTFARLNSKKADAPSNLPI
jgi:hypothetical protein